MGFLRVLRQRFKRKSTTQELQKHNINQNPLSKTEYESKVRPEAGTNLTVDERAIITHETSQEHINMNNTDLMKQTPQQGCTEAQVLVPRTPIYAKQIRNSADSISNSLVICPETPQLELQAPTEILAEENNTLFGECHDHHPSSTATQNDPGVSGHNVVPVPSARSLKSAYSSYSQSQDTIIFQGRSCSTEHVISTSALVSRPMNTQEQSFTPILIQENAKTPNASLYSLDDESGGCLLENATWRIAVESKPAPSNAYEASGCKVSGGNLVEILEKKPSPFGLKWHSGTTILATSDQDGEMKRSSYVKEDSITPTNKMDKRGTGIQAQIAISQLRNNYEIVSTDSKVLIRDGDKGSPRYVSQPLRSKKEGIGAKLAKECTELRLELAKVKMETEHLRQISEDQKSCIGANVEYITYQQNMQAQLQDARDLNSKLKLYNQELEDHNNLLAIRLFSTEYIYGITNILWQ